MTRLRTIAALTMCALFVFPATAMAQDAPYPPPERSVTIKIVNPNVTVEIEGSNYGPGTTVTLTQTDSGSGATAVLGTTVVRGDGTFQAQFAVPDDVAEGDVEVLASGTDASGAAKTDTFVLRSQQPAVAAQTARTGITVWQLLAAGAGLVVLGVVSTLFARRRRVTAG